VTATRDPSALIRSQISFQNIQLRRAASGLGPRNSPGPGAMCAKPITASVSCLRSCRALSLNSPAAKAAEVRYTLVGTTIAPEPSENIPQMPIDAKKMMICGAHRDDSDRFRRQRFGRQMIQQGFQCPGNRSPIHRARDYYSVGRLHAMNQWRGIVLVLVGRAAICKCDPLIGEVNQFGVQSFVNSKRAIQQPTCRA
jgi:hypothetical protein